MPSETSRAMVAAPPSIAIFPEVVHLVAVFTKLLNNIVLKFIAPTTCYVNLHFFTFVAGSSSNGKSDWSSRSFIASTTPVVSSVSSRTAVFCPFFG